MSAPDPLPKILLSPAEIARVKELMGDTTPLGAAPDAGSNRTRPVDVGAWERELAYAAAALAEPDDAGTPLDLDGLDARLEALDDS